MEKVSIILKCPAGCTEHDYYLSLIQFLTEELSKYVELEIVDKEVLDDFKLEQEIKNAEFMAATFQQKANLLRKRMGR